VTINSSSDEIIFEFHCIGAYVKVSAIDIQTGTEISITGSATAPQEYLKHLAQQKLNRKLAQEKM
jgi:hypothetical protein